MSSWIVVVNLKIVHCGNAMGRIAGWTPAGRGVDLGKTCQGQIEILRFLKNTVKLGSSGWPGWIVAKPMKLGLHLHVFSINYPFFGRLVSDIVVVIN